MLHKDELSAGEKQIYAIAILEALAKTSGRHLPIIIDTPLGRLDSEHCTKLINNYFPYASHQVIILQILRLMSLFIRILELTFPMPISLNICQNKERQWQMRAISGKPMFWRQYHE